MKKVLIVSPYFPPFNTADMQRVRQSLPYMRENGWEPTVLTVDEACVEAYSTDPLLLQTVPADIRVEKVKALSGALTRKIGIGSLSLRAYFSMQKKGDELLQKSRYDLVYFSTTAFHVMALGPRWKKKFEVPFVLDIQDPWYNEYYFNHALAKKTFKASLYHKLDKYLEGKTVPLADGIISVSEGYREMYLKRYPALSPNQFCVLPFGCAVLDFVIAKKNISSSNVQFFNDKINAVYIGRGGEDMALAGEIFFDALRLGLQRNKAMFAKLHLWFIGTDYAKAGQGRKSFEPLARQKGLSETVTEIPDRLPYFETLYLLSKADLLFMPGSTDASYTASKIYPYLYLNKPLLAVFHQNSSVCKIIRDTSDNKVVSFGDAVSEEKKKELAEACYAYLADVLGKEIKTAGFKAEAFEEYTAQSMSRRQAAFFDSVVASKKSTAVQSLQNALA